MNTQHPLQRAYHFRQPHVLVSLTPADVDGSLEADTLDEVRQLRRGLITAFSEVSKAIRSEKRRLRREKRETRDIARAAAYAEAAPNGVPRGASVIDIPEAHE
ncbi:hypothetical protein J2Y69_003361 [Microbacterium resistens]|uniref:Uncharacterized protein n=1 Tax=Microbacterium resistens TaxID=156977 RepID=A0ABU1SGK3_9MICO|nr:hypothetical protein [Microbacterium resistens]MDR6868737.1 hypothetical protein [Microbacterium resistens]